MQKYNCYQMGIKLPDEYHKFPANRERNLRVTNTFDRMFWIGLCRPSPLAPYSHVLGNVVFDYDSVVLFIQSLTIISPSKGISNGSYKPDVFGLFIDPSGGGGSSFALVIAALTSDNLLLVGNSSHVRTDREIEIISLLYKLLKGILIYQSIMMSEHCIEETLLCIV